MNLLTANNTKVEKAIKYGYYNVILHLAPYKMSGTNMCPKASAGCAQACLNTAGRGTFPAVQKGRVRKTMLYLNERAEFIRQLDRDIETAKRTAARRGLKLCVRLNGTSDQPALAINTAKRHPDVQFYDYTKIAKSLERVLPANYKLTFSRSETNEQECMALLARGHNVAMVFKQVPGRYRGYKVIDGDKHDLRFLDRSGVIVGLSAKGKAKHDTSGFAIGAK